MPGFLQVGRSCGRGSETGPGLLDPPAPILPKEGNDAGPHLQNHYVTTAICDALPHRVVLCVLGNQLCHRLQLADGLLAEEQRYEGTERYDDDDRAEEGDR
jgi:hypothetical protein